MRGRIAGLLIGLALVLGTGGATLSAQAQGITLTVAVRYADGQPVVGLGVHVYLEDFAEVRLVGDQVTDAAGQAKFGVQTRGQYAVTFYAPPGTDFQLQPEDQQAVPDMLGDTGSSSGYGLSLSMGDQDFTLMLVLLDDGRPYYDRALGLADPPEAFIPGVTDKDWPTPTPFSFVVEAPPATPPPASTAGAPPPTPPATAGVIVITAGRIEPEPFPWLAVIVVGGIAAIGWGIYRAYTRGWNINRVWQRLRREPKTTARPAAPDSKERP